MCRTRVFGIEESEVEAADEGRSTGAEREESAGRALNAYRERRRRRRAEDTYFGSADVLLERVEDGWGERERAQRRIEILRQAEEDGMPPGLAEMLYDIAREEGVDPALAYELVRSGLGVIPPREGVSNATSQPTTDKYVPEWLGDAVPPDDLLRERMLRLSFLRLRSLLRQQEDVGEALRAFANEPDVGLMGY
jgi:hypothetical protein